MVLQSFHTPEPASSTQPGTVLCAPGELRQNFTSLGAQYRFSVCIYIKIRKACLRHFKQNQKHPIHVFYQFLLFSLTSSCFILLVISQFLGMVTHIQNGTIFFFASGFHRIVFLLLSLVFQSPFLIFLSLLSTKRLEFP